MNFKCQACGFTIFNRRYPKCEACGVLLAPGLALTGEERNVLFESERISAEAERKKREHDDREKFDKDSAGYPDVSSL